MQNTDAYAEFWHLATEVDVRLNRCTSERANLNLLAGDDTLEIQLRRLASKVHELRTGDEDAALHTLAISLPGKNRDLPPSWMVQDAEVHSEQKHHQHERVGKSFSRGGGGGTSTRGGWHHMTREVASTTARQEMEAAKTKARVAVTSQVAVAGVEDADDAMRRGAGG